MDKYFFIFTLLMALAASWGAHRLIKRMIDPRRSLLWFLIYVLLHLASVFLIVGLLTVIILRFTVMPGKG
jgi:hypothetical protein